MKPVEVKQNKDGTWYCRPYLGTDGLGRQIRPKKSFPDAKSEAEAQAMATAYVESYMAAFADKFKLGEELDAYVKLLASNGSSPNTIKTYMQHVRAYIKPYFRNKNINDLTVIDFNRFEQYLLNKGGRNHKGLSRNTVQTIHSFLSGAYTYFCSIGACQSNPLQATTSPGFEKRDARSLEEYDLQSLKTYLDDVLNNKDEYKTADVVYAFAMWLSLYTGMRVGEVCGLRYRDVSAARNTIHVSGTVEEASGRPRRKDETKSKKTRNISISPEAVDVICNFREWQEGRLTNLDGSKPIVTITGNYMSPSKVSGSFRDVKKKLKLDKRLTFHSLRHSHATWLITSGIDLRTVSERLGHADPGTTLRIYSHVLPGRDAYAAQVFGDTLNKL